MFKSHQVLRPRTKEPVENAVVIGIQNHGGISQLAIVSCPLSA